jgi:hypothetical protein
MMKTSNNVVLSIQTLGDRLLNVLARFAVLAGRDLHQATEVAMEVALVGESDLLSGFAQREPRAYKFFGGSNSNLRLKLMRRDADRSGEDAIEMKCTEACQQFKLGEGNVSVVIIDYILTNTAYDSRLATGRR